MTRTHTDPEDLDMTLATKIGEAGWSKVCGLTSPPRPQANGDRDLFEKALGD